MINIDAREKFMVLPLNLDKYESDLVISDMDIEVLVIDLMTFKTDTMYGNRLIDYVDKYGEYCFVNCFYSDDEIIVSNDSEIADIYYDSFLMYNIDNTCKVAIVKSDNWDDISIIGVELNSNLFSFKFINIDDTYLKLYINGKYYMQIGDGDSNVHMMNGASLSHFYIDNGKLYIYFYLYNTDTGTSDRVGFVIDNNILMIPDEELSKIYYCHKFKSSKTMKASISKLDIEQFLVKVQLATSKS